MIKRAISEYKRRQKVKRFAGSHLRQAERINLRHARASSGSHPQGQSRHARGVPDWLKGDIGAVIGIVVLVVAGVYFFGLRNERFVITGFAVDGVEYLDQTTVEEVTWGYLNSKWLGLLPKNTYWTAREGGIESAIKERFSDSYALESVVVETDWPNELRIIITERVPSLAWVTKDAEGREYFYTVDRQGIVTEQLQSFDQVNPAFPRVRDDNRPKLGLGWEIISADYLDAVFLLYDQFESVTGLPVDSFVFPETVCQERQYVAEKIFQQEILESESEEFRDRRVAIQEQFQSGALTIDQSLEELERVKQEELAKLGEDSDVGFERLKWERVYVETECDYVIVASDLHIVVPEVAGGFTVRLDTRGDILLQLENLVSVLKEKVTDRAAIEYIDVRIPDRVYIK